MKNIKTKKGLEKLLERYKQAGVTDETMDITNSYKAKWITAIENCIKLGYAMDETDYDNTPKESRKLWKGLK